MTRVPLILLLVAPLAVQGAPFAKGDPKAGQQLHDESCVSCHVRLVGGDGSKLYTRPDRKITTPEGLAQQIAFCNAQANVGWFPEDEENVAAYLNQKYYKFK